MDFREFASKETSSFVDRLNAAAAAQAADARQAAEADAQRIIAPLRSELKERTAHIGTLETTIHDLKTKIDHAEAATRREAEARAAVEKAKADVEKQKAAVEREKAAGEKEKAALEKEKSTLERQNQALEKEIESLEQAKAAADAATAEVEKAKAAAERDLKAARTALDAAAAEKADIGRRLTALEQTHAESDRVRRQLEIKMAAASATEKTLRTQPLDRLLHTFGQLAKAHTSAAVLTTLVDGLGAEFSRVALFTVSSNRLEGMHQVGFDFKSDISKVVMPFAKDSESLLMQAVSSGRVQGHTGKRLTEGSCAPFGGNPAFVLTVPITVRSKTIAVIYADTGEQPAAEVSPERGVKFAELLLWHAVPMLSKLSAELESASEVRNYARLLLEEIEEMYGGDVEANTPDHEMSARVKENLECARRLFSQRLATEGPSASTLAAVFDQELDAVLGAQGDSPYGHYLAAAATSDAPAAPQRSSRRAERA